ncbi:hypothetical protein [Mannheimia haemolytica]|nr:hypothetical protein [Mannheimia haemolytica]UQX68840.1 hypothetical protein M3705_07435 [Mannheimia haemolytica]
MKKLSLRRFLKRPVDVSILDDWAKMANDLAKTAIIVAVSSVFVPNLYSTGFRLFAFLSLTFLSALLIAGSVHFRQLIAERKEELK